MKYPDLSYDFYWLLRTRSGYRLDARIAKAAKIIDQICPNFCPCCKSNKQWIIKKTKRKFRSVRF